ncbi:MAG: helix-turn-helix transcriptional regulator [Alphaproteobacteria bacterium]|nr:helix-turn-helix transcriptional regulator [Alphaproteobacteria bacterium]
MAPAWGEASAAVIDHIDADDLPLHLATAVRSIVAFEAGIFFVNRRNQPPLHIYDTLKSARAKRGVINYIRSTYLLNPFYNAFLLGIRGGVYRINEVAPDAYFRSQHFKHLKFQVSEVEEIGYLTKDWPPGRAEVVVAMELPHGEMGELSLLQPVSKGGFSQDDLRVLGSIAPFLRACFARYWRRVRPTMVKEAGTRPSRAPAKLGGQALSAREREVAYLILKGHSTPSISLHLNISGTTVKTHRKNLYAKLGIASHYELFAMFVKSLDIGPADPLHRSFGPIDPSSFGRMGSAGAAE